MSSLQIRALFPKPSFHFFAANSSVFPLFCHSSNPDSSSFTRSLSRRNPRRRPKPFVPLKASATPDPSPNSNAGPDPRPSPSPNQTKPKGRRSKPKPPAEGTATAASGGAFPSTIPRKPRRGRRSEAVAVEDFVRDRLDRTFASIREQDAGVLEGKEEVLKQRTMEEDEEEESGGKAVVEEEDPDWPLDADIGWGIRASEYFEKHPIKNVVVDGVEIDWEGEMDEGWVKEINCLEWESFAFHPSPLVHLFFM